MKGTFFKARKIAKQILFNIAVMSSKAGSVTFTSLFLRLSVSRVTLKPPSREKEPGITVSSFKFGCPGAFCFSVDFDLHNRSLEEKTRFDHGTNSLVRLSELYGIPMTWAIAGSYAERAPETYKKILTSTVAQDIGGHTYSHVDFSDESYTTEELQSELRKGIAVLNTRIRPVSFVFPWNHVGRLELLSAEGFTSFRSGGKFLSIPVKRGSMWEIPQTYHLVEGSFWEPRIPERLVDIAVKFGCMFAIWTHPWEVIHLGENNEDMYAERVLSTLFAHVESLRKRGILWVCTMRELADYAELSCHTFVSPTFQSPESVRLSVECGGVDDRFGRDREITIRVPIPKGQRVSRIVIDGEQVDVTDNAKIDARTKIMFLTLSVERKRKIEIAWELI